MTATIENSLIEASKKLGLDEKRLILLAIFNAKKNSKIIDTETRLEIPASLYANVFNLTESDAYWILERAAFDLFNREFGYSGVNSNNHIFRCRTRWVSQTIFIPEIRVVEITFAPTVVSLIKRLEELLIIDTPPEILN